VSVQAEPRLHTHLSIMFVTESLKKPIVLIPVIAGVVLPCLVFLILHFSRPLAAQRPLVLKDAVYISGQPLPTTALLEQNGHPLSPDTLRKGKVLLIFLTTDCPACKKELVLLTQADAALAERVTVYGVGIQDQNLVAKFLRANGFKTKFLFDQDGELMRSLHVKYFPARFVVENGLITKTTFGNSRSQADLFKELGL
jgi:peroxiredoxin